MAKYSFEFKLAAVEAYERGEGGCGYLANKYGITNECTLRNWVKVYNEFGSDGLMRSRKQQTYSFEFKLHVVELYLTTEVSYRELALSVGMNNPSLIARWANDFRTDGPDALKPKKRGRRSEMKKPKKNTKPANEKENNQSDYLKQLEEENLKLRIENAYLKELRRLRLEGKPQKKKRESSTASEDPSN